MFLQVKVPPQECRVLRFLWRSNPEDKIGVYEYTRHVFSAKSSPTCANYALLQASEDNSGEREKHDLAKLSPFVDSDNTIRLKGRLSKATISDDLKHPILFSAKHPAVVLMLIQMHEDNHHEGTEYVRSLVQQRLWVIGLRNALRSINSKCVKCRKQAVRPIHPHMVDLP